MEPAEYTTMAAVEDRHWWYAGVHDFVLRLARSETRRTGGPLTILDAGCGTGRLCQLLRPFGSVAGCDLHPLALAGSARRGVQPLWQCDLSADDLGTGKFDLITCMDVLYHRNISDEAAVLHNLHRALKPGGLLLVQSAAFEILRGAHDLAVHTRRRYRRHELVRLLDDAGFEVEAASYRLPWLFPPCLLWRCLHPRAANAVDTATPTRSDLARPCPGFVNEFLTRCVKAENWLLTRGARLPFGTSVFAAARKPAPAEAGG